MEAGKLKDRVTIRKSTASVDPKFKTPTLVWSDHATVWAEVEDALPSRAEKLDDGINITARPCRVRLRFRRDVTTAMRLVINGREYRIISGPATILNRTGIELMCEALTTEGMDG